jgi:hypothetical protein
VIVQTPARRRRFEILKLVTLPQEVEERENM